MSELFPLPVSSLTPTPIAAHRAAAAAASGVGAGGGVVDEASAKAAAATMDHDQLFRAVEAEIKERQDFLKEVLCCAADAQHSSHTPYCSFSTLACCTLVFPDAPNGHGSTVRVQDQWRNLTTSGGAQATALSNDES